MLEQMQDEVVKLEATIPWRNEVPERAARWRHLFTDWKHEASGREFNYDLKHDRVLTEYGVPERELKYRRFLTEMLLDNCRREIAYSLAKRKGPTMLGEAATVSTSDIAAFTTWALPLIRKIWPRLFAHEVCGVRPMSQPTGKAFTLDFQYASSGGVYSSGTSVYRNEDSAYSDDLGEAVTPRKLKMAITGANISVSAKKLITDWSIESVQDLGAYHGLALEPEMMKILGMQIEREKNREIIDGIASAATTNTNWTSTQPMASTNAWSNAIPKEYAESLWDSIMDANKEIYDRVYEDANVMLCGSTFGNRLTKLNSFRLADGVGAGDGTVNTGPNLFGTLAGRLKVFKDPYFTADKAIVIHKSNNWLYQGYLHLNYVPVWVSPTIPETDFTFAKGMMSRYANYAKDGDFFATVTVI